MKWEHRTHIKRPGMVELACGNCGSAFWIPPSKVGQRRCCSDPCVAEFRGKAARERQRPCETCGATFSPRQVQITKGGGRFCSQKCNVAGHAAMNSPEAQSLALHNKLEAFRSGRTVYPSGPANKQWEGGPKACRQRRTADGRNAATLRAYRARNPDKVKEFAHRRGQRKMGRLPRGTISRIKEAQRGRCAVCRTSIRDGWHVDHIVPLARDGEHVARNIQLLCQHCNCTKNAKDPIDFMRSLGRLL